jgi:hypothetical protein
MKDVRAFALSQKGVGPMPFTGIFDPDQLAMLTNVLERHCRVHGVVDRKERESIAIYVLSLLQTGSQTPEELTAVLSEREQSSENRARP